METTFITVELRLTSLGKLSAEERAEVLTIIAKQVVPIPMLPYGVTIDLKSVGFTE